MTSSDFIITFGSKKFNLAEYQATAMATLIQPNDGIADFLLLFPDLLHLETFTNIPEFTAMPNTDRMLLKEEIRKYRLNHLDGIIMLKSGWTPDTAALINEKNWKDYYFPNGHTILKIENLTKLRQDSQFQPQNF